MKLKIPKNKGKKATIHNQGSRFLLITDKDLDVLGDLGWWNAVEIVLVNGTISLNEELDEVPGDLVDSSIVLLEGVGSEELVQRVSVLSVDLDLGEQLVLGSITLSEGLDVSLTAWLLLTELVARESEDLKSL